MKYAIKLPSGEFYAGYTTQGISIVPDIAGAYWFPEREYADNVLGGDERLTGATIVPVEYVA